MSRPTLSLRGRALLAVLTALFAVAARPALAAPVPDRAVAGDTPPPAGNPGHYDGADPSALAASGSGNADADGETVLTSPSLPSLPANDAAAPGAAPPPAPAAGANDATDTDPRALTDFEPRLAPYGAWVDDPKYGRIWVPDRSIVGERFSPYATGGHWALDSDDNWVWVSDYAFGDIVFHYGRWTWTAYGWAWVPGYRYAPAWVVWRVPTGEYAYVGWAPMPPAYYWVGGAAFWFAYAPPYYWVFCPSVYVFSPYPYRYLVTRPGYVHTIAGYTRRYVVEPRGRGYPISPRPAAARIPGSALPASRLPSASLRASAFSAPRAAAGSRMQPFDTHTPGTAPSRTWSTADTSRTWSSAPRTSSPADRAWAPPVRPSVATPRPYSPPRPVTAPTEAWSPARTYSPGARTYSPPRPASAPTEAWRPAPAAPTRVYTPPRPAATPAPSRTWSPPRPSYAPARVYTPTRVYSPPAWHPSPSYGHPGGGAHRR